MNHTILFICTGNYYRSRFAELLFNALALRLDLNWNAVSRGLDAVGSRNVGPISPYVLRMLEELGIPVGTKIRGPVQLDENDLARANRVIALDAIEHRLWMTRRFPEWADQIVYWDVPDLHLLEAGDALSRIEDKIAMLVRELSNHSTVSGLSQSASGAKE